MSEKLFTGDFVKISNFNQKNFVGEGSSPLLCRKYLWIVNPVFRKIYAHKWLCTAVCGHNIFFVNVCWSRRRDLNPRPLRPERSALPSWATPRNMDFPPKWSNMWSKGFLTEILSYRKRRDNVVSKAMCHKQLYNALRGFYAPERSALPNWATSRLLNFSPRIWWKWSSMWSKRFPTKISARRNRRNDVVSKGMCDKRLCNALQQFYAPEER